MKRRILRYRLLWIVANLLMVTAVSAQQWNPDHAIGAVNAKYAFNYNQVPDNLVELYPPVLGSSATLYYQWEQSATPLDGFTAIPGATQSGYTFPAPLAQTTYFRRKVTDAMGNSIYSNTLKIEVVSVYWENLNYVREHTILKPGVSDWKVIDNLPVGDKLQATVNRQQNLD